MINEIFNDLKAEIAKGRDLPVPNAPMIEDELRPFIARPMTPDEIMLMAAADHAGHEARKMVARVTLINQFGLSEEPSPERNKETELLRFHANMLDDLFFWYIQSQTDWKFSMIFQRSHEGRLVLVGLPAKDARAYLTKEAEQRKMAELGDEKPGPRLVIN